MSCTACGTNLKDGARYCPACGIAVDTGALHEAGLVAPPAPPPVTTALALPPATLATPSVTASTPEAWDARPTPNLQPHAQHHHLRLVWAGAVVLLLVLVLGSVLMDKHVTGRDNQSHNAVAGASPSSPPSPSNVSSDNTSTPPTEATPAPATPVHADSPASLLAVDATGVLPIYGGPSSTAFDRTGTGRALQQVTVTCTGYGDPFTALGGSSRLWDYTNVGWLSDQVVETGLSVPAVPACQGNVTSPTPSSQMPSKSLGPFAVVADGPLSVYAQPVMGSPILRQIQSGDLVLTSCATPTATVVAPPSHLTSAGGNAYWDHLQSGGGWIPDSYVDTGTDGPAAPRC